MEQVIMQRLVSAPIDLEIFDTNVSPEVPYNLTGLSVKFTVKSRDDTGESDENALIKKIITVHIDAVNGLTSFVPDVTERAIPVGIYYADIKVFDGASLELNSEVFKLQVVDVIGKTKV